MASSLPTPPAQNKPKARPQGREHDNHLHACAQHAGSGHPKPARLTRIASRKRQSDRLLRVPVTQEFSHPTTLLPCRRISRNSPLRHPACSLAQSDCGRIAQTSCARCVVATCLCSHTKAREVICDRDLVGFVGVQLSIRHSARSASKKRKNSSNLARLTWFAR